LIIELRVSVAVMNKIGRNIYERVVG